MTLAPTPQPDFPSLQWYRHTHARTAARPQILLHHGDTRMRAQPHSPDFPLPGTRAHPLGPSFPCHNDTGTRARLLASTFIIIIFHLP